MSKDYSNLSDEARRIYQILQNGSPSAKLEIIVRAIMDDQPEALSKILNSMDDAEYYKTIPCS